MRYRMFIHHLFVLSVLLSVRSPRVAWSVSGMASGMAFDRVRDDWYFRESLGAIRDWEEILAGWEKRTPEADRTPRFSLPASGAPAEWPNPFPCLLLPAADRGRPVVRLRAVDRKIEVLRARGEEALARRIAVPGQTLLGYKHLGGGGKDRWYHSYHRRFDRWATFRPVFAPSRIVSRLGGKFDRFVATVGGAGMATTQTWPTGRRREF